MPWPISMMGYFNNFIINERMMSIQEIISKSRKNLMGKMKLEHSCNIIGHILFSIKIHAITFITAISVKRDLTAYAKF